MSTEENEALACRALEEIWPEGNLAAAEEIYDPTYIGHRLVGGETFSPERAHQPPHTD